MFFRSPMSLKVSVTSNLSTAAARNFARGWLADAINETAIDIQASAIDNLTDAPSVDTGRLRSSVAIEIQPGGLAARVGTDVQHGIYVETGARPHFPPIAAIKPWARRVLGNENLAYAVAKKIAERGIPPKPWLEPAYLKHVRSLIERVQRKFGAGLK